MKRKENKKRNKDLRRGTDGEFLSASGNPDEGLGGTMGSPLPSDFAAAIGELWILTLLKRLSSSFAEQVAVCPTIRYA